MATKKEIPAYIETAPGKFILNPAYVKAEEKKETAKTTTTKTKK
jgi:hypothetical protein